MTLSTTLSFALTMLVIVLTPGPGVLATIAKAMTSGFSQTRPMIFGFVLGDLIFLNLTFFGLNVVEVYLYDFLIVIKYSGAFFLAYLGVKFWRTPNIIDKQNNIDSSYKKSSFITGLTITLGNPKVMLFYIGILPTFFNYSKISAWEFIIISLIIIIVVGGTMMSYAFLASKAKNVFKEKRYTLLVNRLAGILMFVLSIVLIIK